MAMQQVREKVEVLLLQCTFYPSRPICRPPRYKVSKLRESVCYSEVVSFGCGRGTYEDWMCFPQVRILMLN